MKHVFLIANPFVAMVAYEFIASNAKFTRDNVEIIYIRGQRYSLFDAYKSHFAKRSVFNRASRLIPWLNSYPQSVKSIVEGVCDKFILYTSWLDKISTEIVSSTKCVAHCYLEEGDQAYKYFPVFPSSEDYIRPEKTEENKHIYNHYWRSDALFWVATSSSAFPTVPKEKVIVLSSFYNLKKAYSPRLSNEDMVLLMPTPGRLPKNQWAQALKNLAKNSVGKTYVKLHPGYYELPGGIRHIKYIIKNEFANSLVLLPDSIILEAEMLFSTLAFVGDRSSVKRYAERFGSQFIEVPFLYGDFY